MRELRETQQRAQGAEERAVEAERRVASLQKTLEESRASATAQGGSKVEADDSEAVALRARVEDLETELRHKNVTIAQLQDMARELTPSGDEGTLLRKLQESEKAQVEAVSRATVLDGEMQNYRQFMERTMARHKKELAKWKKKH
jgi:hypothetical protein